MRSEAREDVRHCDPHFQVGIFAQGHDMLLDGITNGGFIESYCDITLHLHAHFTNVGHRLFGSRHDQVYGLL